tara:strand:- start:427 stop:603 length:177 start_codon:yes stop_codon:yes gene_type:complete
MIEDMKDFYLGTHEVELTKELINTIVRENKWSSIESLEEMRDIGAKWNTERDSLIFNS